MKKLNYYLVILLGVLLLACRTDEMSLQERNNQLLANQAKQLFEREQPKFKILSVTDKIAWDNAIISDGLEYETVEIPLDVKSNLAISSKVNIMKPYHRLLFRKSKKTGHWDYYYLFISPEDEKIKKFNNYNPEFNYFNIDENFKGKIMVFNNNNEIVDKLKFGDNGKQLREEETCLWIGWWYEDGHFEPIAFLGCFGGSTGDSSGYGDHSGGGGSGSSASTASPCDKIKNQISAEVKSKSDSLQSFAKTSQKQEKAFREYKDGTTSTIQGGGEHMVNLGNDINTKGIYHNHSLSGVHIQSAGDVSALIELARYQDTINGVNFADDAYVGMVSSDTHYIIMFNGKNYDLPSSYDRADLEKWNDWQSFDRDHYLTLKDSNGKYIYSNDGGNTLNESGLEEIFYRTLKTMGLTEKINLMKIKDNKASTVIQNADGSITSVPCN